MFINLFNSKSPNLIYNEHIFAKRESTSDHMLSGFVIINLSPILILKDYIFREYILCVYHILYIFIKNTFYRKIKTY